MINLADTLPESQAPDLTITLQNNTLENAESLGGVICVARKAGLVGVITDGGIRRGLNEYSLEKRVVSSAYDLMTESPKVVSVNTHCSYANSMMNTLRINSLVVREESGSHFVYQSLNRG